MNINNFRHDYVILAARGAFNQYKRRLTDASKHSSKCLILHYGAIQKTLELEALVLPKVLHPKLQQ